MAGASAGGGRQRRLIGAVLLALWGLALLLPVAVVTKDDIWQGWMVLLFGGLAVLFGQFGWFANWIFLPATVIGMTGARPPRSLAITLIVLLALFTSDALLWRDVSYDNGSHDIQRFGAGYYLWIAAMLGCLAWQIVEVRARR